MDSVSYTHLDVYKRQICRIAREMLRGDHGVGRVIARPFTGAEGNFTRTSNRKDFSLEPYRETMLDFVKNSGREVFAIGKIEDIFANKGITKSKHTATNDEGIKETILAMKEDFKMCIRDSYRAGTIKLLYEFYTSPGFTNEKVYLFEASDLKFEGTDLDEDECIETIEVDTEEAKKMIETGRIADSKTLIGLLHWLNS